MAEKLTEAALYVLFPGQCCSGHCVEWADGTPLSHDLSMANAHYLVQQVAARKAIWQAEELEEAAAVLDAMQTPGNDALELVRRDPPLWLYDRAATLRGGQR